MGKFNEIQDEKTQSWGGNSFTTTVKEDTVEFDSAKDKFTFKDEVEVPSLKVNGESVGAQVQSDWNQSDDTAVDYIKNKPTIPSAQVQSDWNQDNTEAPDYIKNKPTIESQVQADWNQNDSSAKDYIKNRICYDGFDSIVPFATTLDAEGNIGNYLVTGVKGVYFNPTTPILTGTDYTIMIGSKSVTFTAQGSPDNTAGGMGGAIPDAGTSFYQMMWNTSGFQDAPNGETAFFGVGADMTIFSEGESVKFGFPNVSEIDEKYVPFKTIRSNYKNVVTTASFKEHMFITESGALTGIEFNIEGSAESGESHFWQGIIESTSSLSISTSTVILKDSTGSLTVHYVFTNAATLQADKMYKVDVWHNNDLNGSNNSIYAVFTELS